ncbi:MAG: toxin-antitoxin system HicB family antitoxin [bacterium]|nr:toxin-antitoxin system HicB family antitoxin [bacterium]MBK7672855.1 toxin-antitoxin system HicB family antitoxin [bacterium]
MWARMRSITGRSSKKAMMRSATPPPPSGHMAHSGQFRVRLPRTLHARLAVQAEREGVSLNTLVCTLLSEGSARWHAADHLTGPSAAPDEMAGQTQDLDWGS